MTSPPIEIITTSNKPKGLGDTIANYMPPIIKKAAELYTEITGNDCGCNKRQEVLNEMFPYKVDDADIS